MRAAAALQVHTVCIYLSAIRKYVYWPESIADARAVPEFTSGETRGILTGTARGRGSDVSERESERPSLPFCV